MIPSTKTCCGKKFDFKNYIKQGVVKKIKYFIFLKIFKNKYNPNNMEAKDN
jgi:hypothetical protein